MTGAEAHRPSPIPWVGTCPRHWKTIRLKSTVRFCQNGLWGDEPDGVHDIVCVRVADFDRVRRRVVLDNPTYRSVPALRRAGRVLRSDDLLIEKSGGGEKQPVGCVVHFDHPVEAICSNFVARMPVEVGHDARFLSYVHDSLYSLGLTERSIKQTTGIQNLDAEAYLDERVEIPPLAEQRAIAAFLDRKNAAIDALIRKKERQVELLEEKRQALITRAATKGLDPDVPMKDSGIEWLGEIPSRWSVPSIKFLFAVKDGTHDTPEYVPQSEDSFPLITSKDIEDGEISFAAAKYISRADYLAIVRRSDTSRNDIIMPMIGTIGSPALVKTDAPFAIKNVALFKTGRASIDPRYVCYFLQSKVCTTQFDLLTRGGVQSFVSLGVLRSLLMPRSSPEEMRRIADTLDRMVGNLDALVRGVRRSVEVLCGYRQALIFAAVTGKIEIPAEEAA